MEDEAYRLIDSFLIKLKAANGKSDSADFDERSASGKKALRMLKQYDMITMMGPSAVLNLSYLSLTGEKVIGAGGSKNFIRNLQAEEAEIAELSSRHLKVDVANAERIYKDYRVTKWQAQAGFIISIAAFLLSLGLAIWEIFIKKN